MEDIVARVIGLYNLIPFPVIACIAGWLASIGITHTLKFSLPLEWPPRTRGLLSQGTAFWSAFATVMYLIPGNPYRLVLAALTGLWSPMAFAGFMWWLKSKGYNDAADILSGDVRGKLTGNIRENRP